MSRFAMDLLIAGILAAALVDAARAQTALVLTVGSQHLNGGNYCETNPGAGLEHGSSWRALGGFYKNSLCRTSVYAGGSYQPLTWGPWRAGIVGMAVSGYESPVSLAAGLVVAYGGIGNLLWIPSKEGNFGRGVLGFQLELARW